MSSIATIPNRPQPPPISFHDMQGMAEAIASSGLFGMKTTQQALALMLVAQSEGQHPATVTQEYDIIQGKAARKTHSVLSRFQQMGGVVEWHELTESVADATFSHKAGGTLRMTWTIEQAKKAKLAGKDNWVNYPRAMLRARCIAEGIRAVYPAALGGMMVTEELQDLAGSDPAPPMRTLQGRAVESEPGELPQYPPEDFDVNLPAWRKLIQSGKKSADQVIAMVCTKYLLSPEQLQAIRDCELTPAREPEDVSEGEGQ